MSMTQMEKTFSELVFGDTLPKPTLVRLLNVKYSAVMYLDLIDGPASVWLMYSWCVCTASSSSQPIGFSAPFWSRSTLPIAYLRHADDTTAEVGWSRWRQKRCIIHH